MKKHKQPSRRDVLATGLAAIGALMLPGCGRKVELPPTYGNILRMGDNLTYLAHRKILPGKALVREYHRSDISSFPATGTLNPATSEHALHREAYEKLLKGNFQDWRLSVEGKVARPGLYSLNDLMRLPARTQITRHTCEEGWTAIGEWTGVPLSKLLDAAGILPTARFVNFYAFDGYADAIDLIDALHPQTILAYAMNGKTLPIQHGAPLRLRLETQVGYKSMKYLHRIMVADEFDDMGKDGSIQNGWAWYVGI